MSRKPWHGLIFAAAVAAVTLTGCTATSSSDPEVPAETLTAIPSPEPSSIQGSEEEAAGVSVKTGRIAAYEVLQYKAEEGCGCSAEEDSDIEVFPSGSEVRLYRITYTPHWKPYQPGETWIVPDLEVQAQFSSVDGSAVIESKQGKEFAEEMGIPWMPDGLFPDGAGEVQNDVPVSFLVAYYVPEHVRELQITISGYADESEAGTTSPVVLPVPVTPSELQ